jgi:Osmosensitive K+ channel histidine kinase
MMPSSTFFSLAKSQFELLSNSIQHPRSSSINEQSNQSRRISSKIKSIALYLPQENPKNGQLEFMPSIVYPSHPLSERIFIASDAQSGLAPTIPPTLTQLPGFSHASALLPAYPFTTAASSFSEGGMSSSGTVGIPEEVFCDIYSNPGTPNSSTVLSLPLFSGPQTIGILLVWGGGSDVDGSSNNMKGTSSSTSTNIQHDQSLWTEQDKHQISRVGETLALALCMDSDRFQNRIHSEKIRVAMADNLHQVKNPVQALRTFTKLLQRSLATRENNGNVELARLVDDIVIQSERVVDLLLPFDSLLDSMGEEGNDNNQQSLNSYQKLLAPMERKTSDLVLHPRPRSTNTTRKQQDILVSDSSKRSVPTASNQSPYLAFISNTPNDTGDVANRVDAKDTKDAKGNIGQVEDMVKLEMAFVPDVLCHVFSSSKRMAEDLGIDMEVIGNESYHDLPGIYINPKLLQESVINVLDNAIKYVSCGMNGIYGIRNSNPKIRVSVLSNHMENDREPAGVTILVEDNGPGIPKKERQSIFHRGYRGEHTMNHTHGSGIGLHISKDMITKMGGSLEILDNQPKHLQGTVVRFILYRKPNILPV